MALARLALKNLQQRASYSASLLAKNVTATAPPEKQRLASQFLRGLSSAAEEKAAGAHEVAVQEDMFPSGVGNALVQATGNINRLLENIASPQMLGRAKEHDDSYRLRYQMPGVGKDEVKITVEDGVLSIRGEHKDQEEHDSDDESWSSSSYGYYNTSLLLPEDAKLDEIKAEMKDGVLNIVIPKAQKAHKDVKEVEVR
ncbi:hypothetical protein SASPL_126013 [Salvia splendens]|uniref:SHSP domain-containing protein n=1 Tax=Salvia splendens TaxID=180675 RepID=A0A8X8XIN4_SALSN|nr:hypothetical protein SASPL_126013 [Salvia splendens]